MAVDRAPGLRRNANRLASFARHEDRLDLRGLRAFGTDREEIPDRSVHRGKPARDARGRDARFLRQTFAEGGRHVRHRGKFKTPLGVKRMVELSGAKWP